MHKLINEIIQKNSVLGNLCLEAEKSYDDENYFAALACLFIIAEQTLKSRLGLLEGHFAILLKKAKTDGLIANEDYIMMTHLKNVRNKLFHESHYSQGIEFNGLIYPLYEVDTKKLLFENFRDKIFIFVSNSQEV